MGWLEIVQALLLTIKQGLSFGEKALPTPAMREEMQGIKMPRLEAEQKQKITKQCFSYLLLRPKTDIDMYIDFTYDHLHADDMAELKSLMHQRLDHRPMRKKHL